MQDGEAEALHGREGGNAMPRQRAEMRESGSLVLCPDRTGVMRRVHADHDRT